MTSKLSSNPEHVGWLLASLAPENVAKGERLLAQLDARQRPRAIAYARHCVAEYLTEGGPGMRQAYANHKYA